MKGLMQHGSRYVHIMQRAMRVIREDAADIPEHELFHLLSVPIHGLMQTTQILARQFRIMSLVNTSRLTLCQFGRTMDSFWLSCSISTMLLRDGAILTSLTSILSGAAINA